MWADDASMPSLYLETSLNYVQYKEKAAVANSRYHDDPSCDFAVLSAFSFCALSYSMICLLQL